MNKPEKKNAADQRIIRVAQTLIDVTDELQPESTPRSVLIAIRALALLAQKLKLAPAAFDCPSGRDAMTAAAMTMSRVQRDQLSNSNAHTLNSRWAKVVYAASTMIPGQLNYSDQMRACDMSGSDVQQWRPPTLLEGKFYRER